MSLKPISEREVRNMLLEVDKLNGIYKVNGTDMLAGVNSLI